MSPEVLLARGDPPPPAAIDAAVRCLADGGVIGLPTDTVYGVAADPFRDGAAERIFRAKGRPRHVVLPVLVADAEQAFSLCANVNDVARSLAERFWPGPLTLVLPRRPGLGADLGDDGLTIGVRCPAHPVPLALCAQLGPIATTSANRHGEPPVTTAVAVVDALGPALALVLDGGPCEQEPSSVVDVTSGSPKLLRPGRLSEEDLRTALS